VTTVEAAGVPELSVVIPTHGDVASLARCLDALLPQAAAVGAEVIVVDGTRKGGTPPAAARDPRVRWLHRPGLDVFRLRRAGYEVAQAPIIAVTEDHCEPPPDWCSRHLHAHRRHPEAAGIAGGVENATDAHLIDRATFLVAHSGAMPPFPPDARVGGQANVSYKRGYTPVSADDQGSDGAVEQYHNDRLREAGERLVGDDSIVVRHYQSEGVIATSINHFHDGRFNAALRARRTTPADIRRRAGLAGVFAAARTARVVVRASRKGVPARRLAVLIPAIAWLQWCHAAGEILGYVRGEGDAARRIR
jgi:glycosyltransferase involved in cell wall biosynthesis